MPEKQSKMELHIKYLKNNGYIVTHYSAINGGYFLIKKKTGGLEHRPLTRDGKAELIIELLYLRERNKELEKESTKHKTGFCQTCGRTYLLDNLYIVEDDVSVYVVCGHCQLENRP